MDETNYELRKQFVQQRIQELQAHLEAIEQRKMASPSVQKVFGDLMKRVMRK